MLAEKHRMHISLAFLFLMATPECASLPAKGETIRNNIENFARTTLVHISKLKERLLLVTQIEVSTPPIEGLTGICRDLGHLDNELQNPFTDHFSQIEADVSSMEGIARRLAGIMECPVDARPTAKPIDNSTQLIDIYLTLLKVQHYLENLLQNKDKLKVC